MQPREIVVNLGAGVFDHDRRGGDGKRMLGRKQGRGVGVRGEEGWDGKKEKNNGSREQRGGRIGDFKVTY